MVVRTLPEVYAINERYHMWLEEFCGGQRFFSIPECCKGLFFFLHSEISLSNTASSAYLKQLCSEMCAEIILRMTLRNDLHVVHSVQVGDREMEEIVTFVRLVTRV